MKTREKCFVTTLAFLVTVVLLFAQHLIAADLPKDFEPAPAPGAFFAAKFGETSRKPFVSGDSTAQ